MKFLTSFLLAILTFSLFAQKGMIDRPGISEAMGGLWKSNKKLYKQVQLNFSDGDVDSLKKAADSLHKSIKNNKKNKTSLKNELDLLFNVATHIDDNEVRRKVFKRFGHNSLYLKVQDLSPQLITEAYRANYQNESQVDTLEGYAGSKKVKTETLSRTLLNTLPHVVNNRNTNAQPGEFDELTNILLKQALSLGKSATKKDITKLRHSVDSLIYSEPDLKTIDLDLIYKQVSYLSDNNPSQFLKFYTKAGKQEPKLLAASIEQISYKCAIAHHHLDSTFSDNKSLSKYCLSPEFIKAVEQLVETNPNQEVNAYTILPSHENNRPLSISPLDSKKFKKKMLASEWLAFFKNASNVLEERKIFSEKTEKIHTLALRDSLTGESSVPQDFCQEDLTQLFAGKKSEDISDAEMVKISNKILSCGGAGYLTSVINHAKQEDLSTEDQQRVLNRLIYLRNEELKKSKTIPTNLNIQSIEQ